MVERHEALRTVFSPAGDAQRILPTAEVEVPLAELPATEDLGEWLRGAAGEPLDLQAGPLFRLRVARLGADDHALVASAHHAVADGWSMGVIVDELGRAYGAALEGRPPGLPEPMQYREYVRLCTEAAAGTEMADHEVYWLERFASPAAAPDLPADHPRGPERTFAGGRRHHRLPAALAERSAAFGRSHRATPFMTLLSAWMVLLHRLTLEEDLVTGLPVGGRPFDGADTLVGYCSHVLPFRVHMEPGLSFSQTVERIGGEALDAFEHQDYPLARLLERLGRSGAGLAAALTTVFNFNPLAGAPEMTGLAAEPLSVPVAHTPFELMFDLTAFEDGLALDCDYQSARFEPATVDRYAEAFQRLLEEALARPGEPVADLPLLGDAQRRQILSGFNAAGTASAEPRCLHALIESQVDRTPGAPALSFQGQTLSYAELELQANRLAHHLAEVGVRPGELVAVCMARTADLVVALLAVLKAGGAYLPLDPAYPGERLGFMIADSGARVLLTDPAAPADLALPGLVRLRHEDLRMALAAGPGRRPAAGATPGDLAYLLYTSGSTGRPKGVAVEHRGIGALAAWAGRLYVPGELAGVLASTSVCFDLSVFELFIPLTLGGRVILAESALHLADLPEASEVTLINSVPSALAGLIEAGTLPDGVRVVNLAGEPLGQRLVEEVFRRSRAERVYNLYGPTECTIYSTFSLSLPGDPGPVIIGRPVDGTRAYVLDPGLLPVPVGVPGELFLGGAGLARGYLHRPELTAERFVPDPFSGQPGARLYRTLDRARFLPDGRLDYLGRLDRQIKLRGFRIEPGEIEHVLEGHPDVERAAVVVQERVVGGRVLTAFAKPVPGREVAGRALAAYLKARLPQPMVPAHVEVLEELPLSLNGKIDRRALEARRVAPLEAGRPRLAPRTDAERDVAGLWQRVLGLPAVSVDANFFDLGGDSLLLLQLHRQLAERFPGPYSVVDLLRHTTVEAQARFVSSPPLERPAALGRAGERGRRRLAAQAGARDRQPASGREDR